MADNYVFAGEEYLGVDLPDYQQEGRNLVLGFVAVAVLFFVILPGILAGPQGRQLSMPAHIVLNLTGLVGLLWVLLQSSQNSLVPRLVVEAPLLTPQECQSLMERAHKAAIANVFQHKMNHHNNALENDDNEEEEEVDPLLKEPAGWRKDRHSSYPTVDLNVVTDPFTKEDREWLEGILNRRLTPILQRVYGVSPASIRANDVSPFLFFLLLSLSLLLLDKKQQQQQQSTCLFFLRAFCFVPLTSMHIYVFYWYIDVCGAVRW